MKERSKTNNSNNNNMELDTVTTNKEGNNTKIMEEKEKQIMKILLPVISFELKKTWVIIMI